MAIQVSAATPARVDDIQVYGRLSEVSATDIHEVVVAYSFVESAKPAAIEVVSSSEVHVYPQSQERGWFPVRRFKWYQPVGQVALRWTPMGRVVYEIPEALHLLGSASEVYVFPVTTPLKPHKDDSHLRLLDAEARESLERLLGNEASWFHGVNNLIWPEGVPKDVGFLFREGKAELLWFCPFGQAKFNGERTAGGLVEAAEQKLSEWKHQYAQPELAVQGER